MRRDSPLSGIGWPSKGMRLVGCVALLSLWAACDWHSSTSTTVVPGGPARPGRFEGTPQERLSPVECGGADLSGLSAAIYVSPQGADSASCGASSASACKTIQQGVANCNGAGCGVLVRWGLYGTSDAAPPLPDRVVLRDGVHIYGGCRFEGEADEKYRTVVLGPDDGQPALTATAINSPTIVQGLFVKGTDAKTPGNASIAMTVSRSNGLILRNTQLASGRGADGRDGVASDGQAGGNGNIPLKDTGGLGGQACPSSPPGNRVGDGGKGADYQQVYSHVCIIWCWCENINDPHSIGQAGSASGNVPGGAGGGKGTDGCGCNNNTGPAGDGPSGAPGRAGSCASNGGVRNVSVWGGFSEVTWTPSIGNPGASGEVGSGGGGGGSGGMATLTGTDFPGRPGGGGGGGGCGGSGGTGGQQGGASIPLVLFQSGVTRDGLVLIPGVGGKGGNGGPGGKGGAGGAGHAGQSGHYVRIHIVLVCDEMQPGSGGHGGDGGQGGGGAGGAGGNGGPAVGMVLGDGSTSPIDAQGIYPGLSGAAGQRGPGGQNSLTECAGAAGEDGLPGGSAAVAGNMMLVDEKLSPGQTRVSPNGRYRLILQTDGNLALYDVRKVPALWSSKTNGRPTQTAIMQADGNFVLYDGAGNRIWDTGTTGHANAQLQVQDDGNVVLYDGNHKNYWATNTHQE